MIYFDYPKVRRSLAKVCRKGYGCKANVICKKQVARYVSMISRKRLLIWIKINKESNFFLKTEKGGKHLRSFHPSRASVKQIFHRVEYRPEDLDIYSSGTLEDAGISLRRLKSREPILHDAGVMELGSKSKRSPAYCWVGDIRRREFGFINNRFVRNFSIWNTEKVSPQNIIIWKKMAFRIYNIQKRIYKASQTGNKGAVLFLQQRLTNSKDAKYLSVRYVTEDTGNIVYLTAKEKIYLVKILKIDGNLSFLKRWGTFKIENNKSYFMNLSTVQNRAKQALVLMALEPEWEAKFESNSYGFRPGRTVHDTVKVLFDSLGNQGNRGNYKKYILIADLRGCFSNLDYRYLLKKLRTSEKITKQIESWLKIYKYVELHSNPLKNHRVITSKNIIFPFLINVILHGMENTLKSWVTKQGWINSKGVVRKRKFVDASSVNVIRYMCNFVVIHESLKIVFDTFSILTKWFTTTSQLLLREEKINIVESTKGFVFFGYHFINLYKNGNIKVKVYPSKESQKKLIFFIGEKCRQFRSISVFNLINLIKPEILNWASYYKYIKCRRIFCKLDYLILQILRSWVFRRDRKNGRRKIKAKYFSSGTVYTFQNKKYCNDWVLSSKKKDNLNLTIVENWLPKISWISSETFIIIKKEKSVYDGDEVYWRFRAYKYDSFNVHNLEN